MPFATCLHRTKDWWPRRKKMMMKMNMLSTMATRIRTTILFGTNRTCCPLRRRANWRESFGSAWRRTIGFLCHHHLPRPILNSRMVVLPECYPILNRQRRVLPPCLGWKCYVNAKRLVFPKSDNNKSTLPRGEVPQRHSRPKNHRNRRGRRHRHHRLFAVREKPFNVPWIWRAL